MSLPRVAGDGIALESIASSPGSYRSLFENIPLGVVYLRPNGEILDANPAAERILGLTLAEMKAAAPGSWRAVHGDDTPFCPADYPVAVASSTGRVVRDVVMGIRRADAEEARWILVDAFPEFLASASTPYRVIATFGDVSGRRRAEAAERAAESRVRRVEAAGHVGVWEWDLSSDTVDYSAEWKRQIGYDEHEIGDTADEWHSRIHADDVQQVLARVGDYLEQPSGSFGAEFRVRHKDGSYRWFLVHGWAERDQAGRPVRMLGTHVDVTELRRAEHALQKSESALRSLFDAIPESVVLLDRQGTVLAANATFAARMNTTVTECAGTCAWDLLSAEVAARRREWFEEVVDTRKVGVYEDDRGGSRIQHHICPIADPDGEIRRVVIFAVDVTDQHRLAAELIETTERYRQFVETSSNWAWEIDRHGRYTFVGDRVRSFVGYEPEEVLGRSPFDLMPEEEARRIGPFFNDCMKRREPFSAVENLARHKNGSLVVLETSGVPMFDHQGVYRGYRGMDRDVTARKQLEEQLRQSQKLEAIGQLAGGVAHDFNNILAAIMMHIGLLQSNPRLDPDTRGGLGELEAEAQRAATLTRQLLMFSRRAVLSVRPLDLNGTVRDLTRMLQRVIGEHIDLRFEPHVGLPAVQADVRLVEQVLVNLVVNARDAMPKGGRLTIATAPIELADGDQHHPSGRPGLFVRLSVEDTGGGMPDDVVGRIFEPFFTTKEAGKGTGLGLATAHGIVAQHEGWIEVESHVGRGTRFDVFLPVRRTTAAAAPDRPRPSAKTGGAECVLLVEDEAPLRRLVSVALTKLGYRVIQAAHGRDALARFDENAAAIDLVFTDMIMPGGITGLELCERLRAVKPGLKTIVSSGYSSEMAQSGAPTAPGVVFLPKPYDVGQLDRTIRECFDQR
jgi:two-component system, cell cycle sensor histidine kinase and response regulator CckA